MIDWLPFGLPVAAAVALVAILGVPSAFALGLRGLALPAVAAPAGFAILAVASIAAPLVGIAWSPLPPVALSLVLAAILLALRRWIGVTPGVNPHAGRRPTRSWRDLWVALGAAAIGGVIIVRALMRGLDAPDAISQTFDAGFHLGAVRFILDAGNASPFGMELVTPGDPSYYPTLWHGFVALIVQVSGATIPVATNAALFTITAIVWPIGAVTLARAILGPGLRVTVAAGTLAAAFPNFPLFLSGYGVLYPNILAMALLPFLLAATLRVLNVSNARRALPLRTVAGWLFFFGSLGAAAIAHPNVLHAALAWGIAPVLVAVIRAIRGGGAPGRDGTRALPGTDRGTRRALGIIGAAAYAAAILAAWVTGQTSDNAWQGTYYPHAAAVSLLSGAPNLQGASWLLTALAVIGAVTAWRSPRLRWLLGSAATLAVLYLIADGFPTSDWRTLLVGPWYNDPRRLAALIPLAGLPLAVLGAGTLWTLLRPGARRAARAFTARPRRTSRWFAALAIIGIAAVTSASNAPAKQPLHDGYNVDAGRLLSHDELDLLDRLDELVPEGERIANNPLNGSQLGYALADREVLFPHAGGQYDPRAYALVNALVPDPAEACEFSHELEVGYVLDFGQHFVFEDDERREKPFTHMRHLEDSPILSEVDRQGDDVLYRIDGC